MPLFDINTATGDESKCLVALEDWLAECPAAHVLCEATGSDAEKKAATLEHITVGPQGESWDGDDFTQDEIDNRRCEFHLFSVVEGGRLTITEGSDSSAVFDYTMVTRRPVRLSEVGDKRGAYLSFLDGIATLEIQLCEWMAVRNTPRIKQITRVQGPSYPPKVVANSQGEYLFVVHTVHCGDFISDQ